MPAITVSTPARPIPETDSPTIQTLAMSTSVGPRPRANG